MIRLAVAAVLVGVISYALYPQEFRIVTGRVEASARSATVSVARAVRGVLPAEQTKKPAASGARSAP